MAAPAHSDPRVECVELRVSARFAAGVRALAAAQGVSVSEAFRAVISAKLIAAGEAPLKPLPEDFEEPEEAPTVSRTTS